jgi:hypothetical protein
VAATSHTDDDLFHALAARARRASDGRLVLAVLCGLVAALGMVIWRPFGWMVIGSIGLCAAALGAWGITDREIGERGAMRSASVLVLRIARICSVVLGTCAAILAVLVMLGSVLGTWIS